jgi:hypothetical protein
MKLAAETRGVQKFLNLYRWPGTGGGDFHSVPDYSCQSEGNEHRKKNTCPSSVSSPPRKANEKQTKGNVLGPIADSAYITEENERSFALMFGNELLHHWIKVK